MAMIPNLLGSVAAAKTSLKLFTEGLFSKNELVFRFNIVPIYHTQGLLSVSRTVYIIAFGLILPHPVYWMVVGLFLGPLPDN